MASAVTAAFSQSIPYGNNPQAGYYATMADSTRIYYEQYGTGAFAPME
jgi:hypothetical protein